MKIPSWETVKNILKQTVKYWIGRDLNLGKYREEKYDRRYLGETD